MVAVGMRVSPHPPHRSRRTELPHRALASGDGAEADHWMRVTDSGRRKPLGNQTPQLLPSLQTGIMTTGTVVHLSTRSATLPKLK